MTAFSRGGGTWPDPTRRRAGPRPAGLLNIGTARATVPGDRPAWLSETREVYWVGFECHL